VNFNAIVFVTVFTVANKIRIFMYVAAAKMQPVRRLVTHWTIRGSSLSGGKISTASPRIYLLLCLKNVRILRSSVR